MKRLTDDDVGALSMLLEDYIDHTLQLARELRQYRHLGNVEDMLHKRVDLAHDMLLKLTGKE